ncbi:DUF6998 domain-containing protein [Curtobacterium sp. MCBD17_030]|uniref:DUF6998 domain-containing protein n=1 Tax=Curtobacterium sp. MCBD17_030 TaxID=2175649 RepID=UPI000D9DE439|nr:hypothetical protein [Curtobacterium sp. MCBD17_030]PYY32249.1 hypothetical protein DEI89_13565 [Curtobacterium sp. MCBD17_030]
MPAPQPPFDAASMSVRELLASYVAILDELETRHIIRTRNSPLGDLAETLAQRMYGGTLQKNSGKSFDLLTEDGQRVQVKARAVIPGKPAGAFSALRTWDFELGLFILLDAATYDILWARELTPESAEPLGYKYGYTNSTTIAVRRVATVGRDVTDALTAAYDRIDEPADE